MSCRTMIPKSARPTTRISAESRAHEDGRLPETAAAGPGRSLPTPGSARSRAFPASEWGRSQPLPTAGLGCLQPVATSDLDLSQPLPAPGRPQRLPPPVPGRSQPLPPPVPGRSQPLPPPVFGRSQPLPASVPGRSQPLPPPVFGRSQPLPASVPGRSQPLPPPGLGRSQPLPASVPGRSQRLPASVPGRSQPLPQPGLGPSQPLPPPIPGRSQPLPAPARGPTPASAAPGPRAGRRRARDVDAYGGRPLTAHRGRSLTALGLLLALAGCGAPCETGEPCERRCPPGGVGICAAHGLCACVADPGFDPAAPPAAFDPLDPIGAAGADGAGDPAADPPSGDAPGACAPATPGALVINEVMLDGEPSEDAEFVELVNPGDRPVALAGLSLTSSRGANQVQRVAFTGGCLPPRGALAMFPDRAAWIEAPASPWPIAAEPRSFGFANSADFDFRLTGPDGAPIDQLTGPGDAIRSGVSLNRAPDLRGPAVAPHSTLDAAGLSASPGACPNGGRYAEACAPPPPELIPGDLSPAVDEPPPAAALAEPPDAGAGSDDSDPAPGALADAPDAAPPPDCPLPEPGDLVIAEVLVDGTVPRTETDEFVELVNRTPLPRRLHGVGLGYEKQGHVEPRVRFEDGCLPAHGAIVVRPRLDDWTFAPPPAEPITITRAELALGNETRDPLVVVDADGAVLARFPLAGQPITEGTSLTRHPGLDGDPMSHDRLGPRRSSPGTCPDGRPFGPDDCAAAGLVACRPAEPGELVIDEVLVDGVEPGEADEFVELVNRSDDPLALAGVALLTNRGADVVERVRFDAGCLAPGALVALYAATERWVWSEPAPGVVADVARFGFPNDAPFIAELRRDDVLLDGVRLARSLFAPGISAARAVHADPDAHFVRHDELAATPSSPGRVADEAALEAVR